MKKNLINKFAPFHAYEGTEDVDFAKELHIVSDNIFTKYKGNAFTNFGLDILLKKHNIEYVEVVGVDGRSEEHTSELSHMPKSRMPSSA